LRDLGTLVYEKNEAHMRSQQDSAGGLRHLITLDGLARDTLTALLDRAESYRRLPGQPAYEGRELAGVTVANLFFEPSTRTRASFDLASRRLGAHVLNLDMHRARASKGETMLDTIYTLEAMNTDVFVIRDSEAGMPEFLIDHVAPHVGDQRRRGAPQPPDAGPARRADDTLAQAPLRRTQGRDRRRHQALARRALDGPRAANAGHDRPAAGRARAAAAREDEFAGAQRFTRIEDGIAGADVVMMLRIQKERMGRQRRCRR
jgi:aspartate carbamoyltransferase catalytic subunit